MLSTLLLSLCLLGAEEELLPNQPIVSPSDRPRTSGTVSDVSVQAPPLTKSPTKTSDSTSSTDDKNRPGRRITARSHPGKFTEKVDSKKAGEGEEPKLAPASQRVTWWVSTALGLFIVLPFIFLGGRMLRSLAPGLGTSDGVGPIHVLHRTLIAPKQSVCLIRCGGRLLLVGVSGERMTTLSEITDPEEIDFLKGQCMQLRPKSTTRAFRDLFGKKRDDWNDPEEQRPSAPSPSARANPADFARHLNLMKERLLGKKAGAT